MDSTKQSESFEMDNGDIRIWLEAGEIRFKSKDNYGGPIDLGTLESEDLACALLKFADKLDGLSTSVAEATPNDTEEVMDITRQGSESGYHPWRGEIRRGRPYYEIQGVRTWFEEGSPIMVKAGDVSESVALNSQEARKLARVLREFIVRIDKYGE